jgi:hypothetical protein
MARIATSGAVEPLVATFIEILKKIDSGTVKAEQMEAKEEGL